MIETFKPLRFQIIFLLTKAFRFGRHCEVGMDLVSSPLHETGSPLRKPNLRKVNKKTGVLITGEATVPHLILSFKACSVVSFLSSRKVDGA